MAPAAWRSRGTSTTSEWRRARRTASSWGCGSPTPTSTSGSRRSAGSWRARRPRSWRGSPTRASGSSRRPSRRTATSTPTSRSPEPAEHFANLAWDHELYCAGHLIQAAIAHARGPGDTRLLDVARRLADHIDEVFGPGRNEGTPGHPEIETALVELSRLTGERRYLELASFLVDTRGHGTLQPAQLRLELLPGPRAGARGDRGHGPLRARPLPRRGRHRPPHRDRRRRSPRGHAGAVAGHGRPQDLPHRRARRAPLRRGVRRSLRAAARPLLRRDLRRHRVADVELAPPAADRRGAPCGPVRAHALQRLHRRARARRPRLLLRQPAARPRRAPRPRGARRAAPALVRVRVLPAERDAPAREPPALPRERRPRRPPGPPVRDRADPRRGGRAGGHHRLSVGRPRRARGRRDRRGAVDAEPARAAVGGGRPAGRQRRAARGGARLRADRARLAARRPRHARAARWSRG